MDARSLAGIDLNLLVLFVALYKERSVSRAARRVGLSQSAASHALSRLRDLTGDELFVRVGRGMLPTPRADALAGPVSEALAGLVRSLARETDFDPMLARASFRIGAVDLAAVMIVPQLMLRIAERAPNVQLIVSALPEVLFRKLADGEIDLALGGAGAEVELRSQIVLQEEFVCLVRSAHPCLQAGLTVEGYASLPHALVSPRGLARGYVDTALARIGLSRQVVYVTPTLQAAASVVARSDLVLTTTRRTAQLAAQSLPLALVEPPLPIEPYVLSAIWHERRDADPLHLWIRAQLLEVIAELS